MNPRFLISVVVIFVLSMLLGYTVHGGILAPDYTRLATMGVYRIPSEAGPLMPYMLAANLAFAIGYTWIYRMGRESRPWPGQGVRFGIAVWLVTSLPTYLIYYVVTPIPSDLAAKQAALMLVAQVVMGLAAAYVNRDPLAPAVRA